MPESSRNCNQDVTECKQVGLLKARFGVGGEIQSCIEWAQRVFPGGSCFRLCLLLSPEGSESAHRQDISRAVADAIGEDWRSFPLVSLQG